MRQRINARVSNLSSIGLLYCHADHKTDAMLMRVYWHRTRKAHARWAAAHPA